MKALIKIILILLAVFPLWVTIMAMAETPMTADALKMALNRKLLASASDSRRIQIIQMGTVTEPIEAASLSSDFEIEISDLRGVGAAPVELRFLDAEKRLKKLIKLTARILVEEKCVVAARAVNQGEVLQEADLTTDWVNVIRFGSSRPLAAAEIIGRRARVGLRAMNPILSSHIEFPSMVKAGDRVEIKVIGNSLSVSGFGIAKQSGEKGATIRIVNPDSRKEVFGTVTDVRKVEVRL